MNKLLGLTIMLSAFSVFGVQAMMGEGEGLAAPVTEQELRERLRRERRDAREAARQERARIMGQNRPRQARRNLDFDLGLNRAEGMDAVSSDDDL